MYGGRSLIARTVIRRRGVHVRHTQHGNFRHVLTRGGILKVITRNERNHYLSSLGHGRMKCT